MKTDLLDEWKISPSLWATESSQKERRLQDGVSKQVSRGGLQLMHGLKDFSGDKTAVQQVLEVKGRIS